MKKLLMAAVLLSSSSAIAQVASLPTSQPDPVPMKLPRAMIQTIGNALMKWPYEQSAPVLAEMQRQLDEADKAAKTPAATPTPAKPADKK